MRDKKPQNPTSLHRQSSRDLWQERPLGSCRINGRENREYRFLPSLHLLMQHIVHFEHGDQSRGVPKIAITASTLSNFSAIFQTKPQDAQAYPVLKISIGLPTAAPGKACFSVFGKLHLPVSAHSVRPCSRHRSTSPRSAGMGDNGKILFLSVPAK